MENVATTLAVHHKFYAISIPAAASPFANLATLLIAAGYDTRLQTKLGFGIFPTSGDYRVATVVGGAPFYKVPAGDPYTQPVIDGAEDTFIRADAGAAVPAVVAVYWKP